MNHFVSAAKTVLVVEHYPALCHIAALLLGRLGYRVLTATTSEQAKRIARENDIDLILLDLQTPGSCGEEVATWFRAVQPQAKIVFIFNSPISLRSLAPCHFVENPFIHLDTLVKEVREVLTDRCAEAPISAAA